MLESFTCCLMLPETGTVVHFYCAMHAVRVQRNKKSKAQDEVLTAEVSKLAEPFLKIPAEDEMSDSVGFSAGNPRVEHITGVVHLFRHIPPGAEDAPVALPV